MPRPRIAACLGFALGCLALCGCAVDKPYAARALLGAALGAGRVDTRQFTDEDVQRAFSRAAQLKLPAKLAIYEATSRGAEYDIRDNETIETIVELLKDEKKFYQIVVLAPTFIQGDIAPMSLRRAAASHRADLTLLCESDFQVRVRPRILAILDLTIVGAFLVPSRQIEVESRVTAHLIDTRNGLIYHSTLRKKQWHGFLPMAWGKDAVERHRKELANENYKQVAEDFKANLQHAERMATEPTAPAIGTRPAGGRAPAPEPPGPEPAKAPEPRGVRYGTTTPH